MIKLTICFFITVISVANSAVTVTNPRLPLESLCSMNGTGVANVTGLGENIPFVMKRVRNFVRYDFFGSDQEVAVSLLVRPDLGNTYFDVGSSCASIGRPLSLSYYEYSEDSKDGSTTFVLGTSANITLNKDSIPISEHFTGLPGDVNIDVQYTSVDYEYFFNGDYFVLKNCAGAESNSSDARTSVQCGIKVHDEICSFHGVGTSVVEGVQELFTTEVYRVSDYSRYDLYNNTPEGPVLYASLVERLDLNTRFIFNASMGGSCYSHKFEGVSYRYNETIDGLDIYMGDGKEKQKIVLGHEDKSIVMEVVPFHNNETGVDVAVTITYESVDYNYEHNEEDGVFSLTNSFCPEAATNATEAITSARCYHVLMPKYPRCSFDFTVTSPTAPGEVAYFRYHVENPGYGYFEMLQNGEIAFLRCDIMNMAGRCLMVFSPGTDHCYEQYEYFQSELFFMLEYHGDPVDVECPDKSTGCKKYSYSDTSYIIVDKEGRYVFEKGNTVTYTDRLSLLDNFTFQRCDGTILEPPPYRCDDFPSSSSSIDSDHSSSSSSITDSQGDATDWWVEIEFKERVLATEVNATAVLESIGVECGLEMSEMAVRIETDENGYVVRVFVYVKDEATALSIFDTLNDMDEGAKCKYDILCRVKSVKVHMPFQVISGSSCLEMLFSCVCLLAVILFTGNLH